MGNKRPPDSLRWAIFERDGWKCLCCGVSVRRGRKENRNGHKLAVADHIIPKSKEGEDTMENLQTLCWECDANKRDQIIDYR